MVDERSRKLIKCLVERELHEINDLEHQIGLTRRQLEYTLEKINEILSDDDYMLLSIENNRLLVTTEIKEKLISLLMNQDFSKEYIMNALEREKYLFLILFYYFDEHLSISYFTEELRIGKTTVLNDLKKLTWELEKENITVTYSRKTGYRLSGDEFDIRYYLMKMLIWGSTEQNATFIYDYFINNNKIENYQQTKEKIEPYLVEYQVSFVENRLKEFIYTLIFLQKRLLLQTSVGNERYNIPAMVKMKEYRFSQAILSIYQLSDDFSPSYLCAWILGLSIGKPDVLTVDYEIIIELVKRIILRFGALSGIRFSNQELVIRQLYSHLRPAYYRLYFKLPIVNPFHEKIKQEYSEMFKLVEEALKPIGSLFEHSIPEEEIAFLTMHFVSLSSVLEEKQVAQKVALIVCPNGIGSSSIIYTELRTLFPEISFMGPVETNEIENFSVPYDLIFSTVPNIRLFYTKKQVYVVSPIMNTVEKYRLISDVYSRIGNLNYKFPSVNSILEVVEKHTNIVDRQSLEKELYDSMMNQEETTPIAKDELSLYQITDPTLIQLNVVAHSWEEAIRLSGAPLLKHGKVTRNYIDIIIETAKREGPYMVISKHVALPHARPIDGVEELSISITTLKYPIKFGSKENDPVKYIFCLAATENNRHINAMAELVNFLDDPNFFTVLDTSQDSADIYQYLMQMEK